MEGTWDATVTVNNVPVPFRIEIGGIGADVHSYFFNGVYSPKHSDNAYTHYV